MFSGLLNNIQLGNALKKLFSNVDYLTGISKSIEAVNSELDKVVQVNRSGQISHESIEPRVLFNDRLCTPYFSLDAQKKSRTVPYRSSTFCSNVKPLLNHTIPPFLAYN